VFALIICVVVWMCRQPPDAVRARWLIQHGYSEVPFQVSKGVHFDIMACGNGKPLRLLIDTGAEFNLIDAGVPKRLDLLPEPIKEFLVNVAGHGHTQTQGRLLVKDFTVGDLHGPWQALVVDHSHLNKEERFGEAPRDGLLGSPYLTHNAAVIDCGSKKLFLWNRIQHSSRGNEVSNRGTDPFSTLLKRQGYLEVPLPYTEWTRPYVPATINGEPLLLDVDTGSSVNALTAFFAERLHLPMYYTAHGSHKTHAEAFSVGGHSEAMEALLVDSGRLKAVDKSGEHTVDGILGAGFLLDHAAVIDCGSKKLYLLAH